MNLYEHTIVARQDTSPTQIKQLKDRMCFDSFALKEQWLWF